MKRYFAALLSVILVFEGGALIAQESSPGALIDPGWDDPFFANYLQQQGTRLSNEAVSFSLPVLGFPTTGAPGPETLEPPLGDRLAATVEAWPACANDQPSVVTVPNKPEQAAGLELGTWFTSTYDYGCLQIVVEGDRNLPDPALISKPAPVPQSGSIEISRLDENDGAALNAEGNELIAPNSRRPYGDVLIGYTRGNLVYTITVSCGPESEVFCSSDSALRALVGQLTPLAGRPNP
jgi:hypothetical protein